MTDDDEQTCKQTIKPDCQMGMPTSQKFDAIDIAHVAVHNGYRPSKNAWWGHLALCTDEYTCTMKQMPVIFK